MSKNPKSIVISFRLSPVVVAKAIDGLKHYDKSADITKLSSIIKQTALHGINYLTGTLPWEASEESQRIVHELTSQGKKRNGLEELILNQGAQRLPEEEKESEKPTLSQPINQSRPARSYLEKEEAEKKETKAEIETQSTKTNVTDFSMSEELMQEIEEKETE